MGVLVVRELAGGVCGVVLDSEEQRPVPPGVLGRSDCERVDPCPLRPVHLFQ